MLDKDSRIECCTNNLTMDSWETLRESEKQFDQQYCLQRCGTCHDEPFMMVDGEMIRGTSYNEMLDKVISSEGD